MSVQALGWVLDNSPTKGTDRLVLIALANHAGQSPVDGAWESYPGIETIRRESGLGRERTVQEALARLIEGGHVERVVNGAPDSRIQGNRRPNLYRILLTSGVTDHGTPNENRGAVSRHSGVPSDASRGDVFAGLGVPSHGTQTISEPLEEPSKEPFSLSAVADVDERPEVTMLCELLAERMIANGCNPPRITKRWKDACRLMIDNEGKSVEQIRRAIEWSQNDEFWRCNIHSMPTLRAKYDQLRLKAMQQQRARGNGAQQAHDTTKASLMGLKERHPE